MNAFSPRSDGSPSLPALVAGFATIYLIWGSTYLAIRFAIETIPPFSMAGWRFVSAGLLLLAWTRLRGAPRPSREHWRSALIIGGLLLVTGNGLLSWAEKTVPSGIAALIVATVPLWMVLLEALRRGGSRPGPVTVVGLLLGLVGIGVLVGPSQLGGIGDGGLGEPVDPIGAATICFASFSWALGSIYSKRAPQTPSTLQNVGMQMLLGGVCLLVLGFAVGERVELAAVSARSAWSLVYLALAGGIVSYSAYLWLLKVSTPAKVSTYAYVNPVVAVVLGWALAGERLDLRVLLAAAAVVTAVVLITTARIKKAPAEPADATPATPLCDGKPLPASAESPARAEG